LHEAYVSDPSVDVPAATKSYPRLIKWALIFTTTCTVIIVAVQLYGWLAPVSLPDCNDSTVQSSIRDILRDKITAGISAMDGFTSAAKTSDSLACTADLTFGDQSRGRLSYRVYLQGGQVMVATDTMKSL
jgi:hypothetical protein